MSKSEFYCEPCEKECGNASNLKYHLASKAHRAKVDEIIQQNEFDLNESISDLAKSKAQLATINESIERKSVEAEAFEDLAEEIKAAETRISELEIQEKSLVTIREQVDAAKIELERLTALESELSSAQEKLLTVQGELDSATLSLEDVKTVKSQLEVDVSALKILKSSLESEALDLEQKRIAADAKWQRAKTAEESRRPKFEPVTVMSKQTSNAKRQWRGVGGMVDRHESHTGRNLIFLTLFVLGLIAFYAAFVKGVL